MKRSSLMLLSLALFFSGIVSSLLLYNASYFTASIACLIIVFIGFGMIQSNYLKYLQVKTLRNHMFSLFYIPLIVTVFGLILTIELWGSKYEVPRAMGLITLIDGGLWFLMCFCHIDDDYKKTKA